MYHCLCSEWYAVDTPEFFRFFLSKRRDVKLFPILIFTKIKQFFAV